MIRYEDMLSKVRLFIIEKLMRRGGRRTGIESRFLYWFIAIQHTYEQKKYPYLSSKEQSLALKIRRGYGTEKDYFEAINFISRTIESNPEKVELFISLAEPKPNE